MVIPDRGCDTMIVCVTAPAPQALPWITELVGIGGIKVRRYEVTVSLPLPWSWQGVKPRIVSVVLARKKLK